MQVGANQRTARQLRCRNDPLAMQLRRSMALQMLPNRPCGAGNDETAEVLALIEEGVPLHWSRDGHEFFPDSFRHKVQPGFVSKHRANV